MFSSLRTRFLLFRSLLSSPSSLATPSRSSPLFFSSSLSVPNRVSSRSLSTFSSLQASSTSSFSSSSSSSLLFGAGILLSSLALSFRSVEAKEDTPFSDEALLADVAALIVLLDKWVKEGKEIERSYHLLLRLAKLQPTNVEILWRLSRAQYDYALEVEDKEMKKKLTYDCYETAKVALQYGENHSAAHKRYGVALSAIGDYEPVKTKIGNAYKIKEHFDRAAVLNPADPFCPFLRGKWQFAIAEMPWYQRQVASILFATPPTSSYEEALASFLEAEKVSPNFYIDNHLMIGRTYYALGDKANAKVWLLKVLQKEDELESVYEKKMVQEAKKILAYL